MVDEAHSGSLPVASDDIHQEFAAAFARIAEVPVGATLIDLVSSELWAEEISDCIAAGGASDDEELQSHDGGARQAA